MNEPISYDYEIPEELINGQPVAMSPRPAWRHISIAGNIYRIFANYLDGKPCKPIQDGMDLYLNDKDHFIPDMMVVCERDKIHYDAVYGAPTLVVEILSPSTAKRDRTYKKDAYEKAGVKEYWIINPLDCSIEVYLLEDDGYLLDEIYTLPQDETEKLTEGEKAALPKSFQCRQFPGLEVILEKVFDM